MFPTLNQEPAKIAPQNLIKQVSSERIILPPGYYKSIILDILTIGAAALVGYFSRQYVVQLDNNSLLYGALAFTLFATFSVLEMFLQKELSRRFLVLALESVAMVSFFHHLQLQFLAIVAAVVFFFLAWGEWIGRSEINNAIEIKFLKTIKPQLDKMITAIVLMTLLLYLPEWDEQKSFFSPESFGGLYVSTARVAGGLYPEINFTETVGDFAKSIARSKLQEDRVFRELTPTQQDKAISDGMRQVTVQLGKSLNITLESEERLQTVFYNLAFKTFKEWRATFDNRFLFAWAVAIFFLFRGLGALYAIITSGFIFFAYQLLIAMNVIHLAAESRAHEVVEYS